jgi:hypothetical protein
VIGGSVGKISNAVTYVEFHPYPFISKCAAAWIWQPTMADCSPTEEVQIMARWHK